MTDEKIARINALAKKAKTEELTDAEKKAVSGWRADGGAPLLTSQGLGCEGLNLRLGTQAEAWLITLRVKAEPTGMTFGPAN